MSFYSISKYRAELMGYAILGVLIGHIIDFGGIPKDGVFDTVYWLSSLLRSSGFLFLSGLGVYYSLSKDGSALGFYQRRFYRFILPFLIMAMPYFLVVTVANHGSVFDYLGYITTAHFWIHGNYHGMWYIAISLLLYAIIPPLFHWYSENNRTLWVKVFITLLVVFIVNALIKLYFPNYWSMVEIGLFKVPCFFVGLLFGFLSKNVQRGKAFYSTMLILGILYIVTRIWDVVPATYSWPLISVPFSILFLSLFFTLSDSCLWLRWINIFYRWLGKYTFELYMLHIFLWFIVKETLHLGAIGNIVVAVVLALALSIPIHWLTTSIRDWIQNKITARAK